MEVIHLLGGVAGAFGAVLLVLPSIRVGQGRLETKRAVGLWISGFGFVLLAWAAFMPAGPAVQAFLVTGVLLAIAGNIIQRFVSGGRL
jgi:hypothetical protein